MKLVLSWMKSNPVTVASIVAVVLSLGFLVWVQLQGSALADEMAKEQNRINQLRSLTNRSVDLPPEEPDGPEQEVSNITINQVAIDQLTMLYDRMEDEYEEIFAQAREINQGFHEPLVPNLFPRPRDADVPYLAREAYIRAFDEMFLPYPADADGEAMPRLNAGLPPAQQEVSEAVQRVENDFRSSPSLAGQQLTEEDQQILYEEKQAKAIELLNERATSLHIYAQSDRNQSGYPFQIMGWGFEPDRPTEAELWEGQLELWIQQDLVTAIAITNGVNDPSASVIEAPVKRLLKIDVLPGYVGLHTAGGLYGSSNVQRNDGSYPAPVAGRTGSANSRVSDNFHVGPTGRVSNALYDVRHARLQVVVDYARLTELFNNLAAVNFMTVLSVELEDVDEYAALEQGFIYGSNDVVQATLLIETVWLRNWTEQWMPSLTRQYVGIDEATDLDSRGSPQRQPGVPAGGYDYY